MLPIAVARTSSGGVTKSQGEGAISAFFFSDDNALYNKASETHTKVAEPIEMPFGMMTWVGHKYHVLDRGPDPPRKRGNFGGKRSGPL